MKGSRLVPANAGTDLRCFSLGLAFLEGLPWPASIKEARSSSWQKMGRSRREIRGMGGDGTQNEEGAERRKEVVGQEMRTGSEGLLCLPSICSSA